ncbi:MAG TPA: hypothetical protein EYP04_02880 [Anaerolineae bacterium]|nr:hypothetical protein [Anaerolineae bacterium]
MTNVDVLVIPGIEVTLPEGHANILGLQDWVDWRVGHAGLTMEEVLRTAQQRGSVTSVTHPLLAPWDWRFADVPLEVVDCLELCNDPSYPANDRASPAALALWSACLNAGYRITGVGGSDAYHLEPGRTYRGVPERIGQPSTYVYARKLSAQAILEGTRAGRAYVSLGPRLAFSATCDGHTFSIGDEIEPGAGPVHFEATASGIGPDHHLHLIRCGESVAFVKATSPQCKLIHTVTEKDAPGIWYRLDVQDDSGSFVAATNPIFIGRVQPQPLTFGEAVDMAGVTPQG